MSQVEALDSLKLPASFYIQTGNFLSRIETCLRLEELQRLANRAEGFVFGTETVRALNYSAIEGLYRLHEHAVQAHYEALQL